MSTTFEEISPADFFYRNREIAGFTNPVRATYSSIRELVENSLDASDLSNILPDIYIRLAYEGQSGPETAIYRIRVEDNGSGIPARHIPSAFGHVLFGSKYKLRQTRGMFGLGMKMAILHGQITTHKPVYVASSTGTSKIYEFKLSIDIEKNRPNVLDHKVLVNNEGWHGVIVEFYLEGNYVRAMSKILEYLKQTAVVNPYANIIFVDPMGRLCEFNRVTTKMPSPPRETKPHPYGVDVEVIQRLVRATNSRNMLDFMKTHFHRVGENTALSFLDSIRFVSMKDPKDLNRDEIEKLVDAIRRSGNSSEGVNVETIENFIKTTECHNTLDFMKTHFPKVNSTVSLRALHASGLAKTKDPKKLKPEEIVTLVQAMRQFKSFLPPDAGCLSPLGEELLKAGILKELNPEFVAVTQRKPSAYAGHPFIVETAMAYGGNIPKKGDFILYRFANRIPLLYDEVSDVSWKIIKTVNWRRYKITPDMPIAILVHLCSTKVPYKTVGKEFIADRQEIRKEILKGLRDVARELQHFLTRQDYVEKERKRLSTFSKYLPKIAKFSTELAEKEQPPDIEKLLKSVKKFEGEGD